MARADQAELAGLKGKVNTYEVGDRHYVLVEGMQKQVRSEEPPDGYLALEQNREMLLEKGRSLLTAADQDAMFATASEELEETHPAGSAFLCTSSGGRRRGEQFKQSGRGRSGDRRLLSKASREVQAEQARLWWQRRQDRKRAEGARETDADEVRCVCQKGCRGEWRQQFQRHASQSQLRSQGPDAAGWEEGCKSGPFAGHRSAAHSRQRQGQLKEATQPEKEEPQASLLKQQFREQRSERSGQGLARFCKGPRQVQKELREDVEEAHEACEAIHRRSRRRAGG